MNEASASFEAVRGQLFGISYRMTGSVSDAEDICQETWIRWNRVDRHRIDNEEAYLVTLATRLAIDELRSARRRRETYVGPWLPEPLPEDMSTGARGTDPDAGAELADSLTFGFLIMLDELTATERAVLLLHDVFGHGFAETAAAVGSSEAAARKTASRARAKIRRHDVDTPRSDPHLQHAADRRALEGLAGALIAGDSDTVMSLMAPQVVQLDDGGPDVRAARRPVVGPFRVARLLINLTRRMAEAGDEVEPLVVNGAPALLVRSEGRPRSLLTLSTADDGLIDRIWVQLNPEKLAHLD